MLYNEMRFTPFGKAMFPEHGGEETMASAFPYEQHRREADPVRVMVLELRIR